MPNEDETGALVGSSLAMQELRSDLRRVAVHKMPVLLLGESGVGKTIAADFIHRESKRTGKFVAWNCATFVGTLAIGDLFGQETGMFTDGEAKPGAVREARGGTLFLDEVGDLDPKVQPMLLKLLDDGHYRPLGGKEAKADLLIVAATNKDPSALREDLLSRLSGGHLRIPPLRERLDDIPELVSHFCKLHGGDPALFHDDMDQLVTCKWPWNVRQLNLVIQKVIVFKISVRQALQDQQRLAMNPPQGGHPKPLPRGAWGKKARKTLEALVQDLDRATDEAGVLAVLSRFTNRKKPAWVESLRKLRIIDGEDSFSTDEAKIVAHHIWKEAAASTYPAPGQALNALLGRRLASYAPGPHSLPRMSAAGALEEHLEALNEAGLAFDAFCQKFRELHVGSQRLRGNRHETS